MSRINLKVGVGVGNSTGSLWRQSIYILKSGTDWWKREINYAQNYFKLWYSGDSGLTWEENTELILSEGDNLIDLTHTYRHRIVDGDYHVDEKLTATGYTGTEGVDWRNIEVASPNWTTSKLLEFKRSGLDLIETNSLVSAAKIIPSCGKCDATNYLTKTVANFASGVASGFIESDVYYNGTSTPIYVFSSSDEARSDIYVLCNLSAGKPRINTRNTTTFSNVYIATNAVSTGWHRIKWVSTGSAYQIYVDGNLVAGSATSGSDDGKWFSSVPNRDNIAIGVNKTISVSASQEHYVSYVNVNDTNKWYITGAGLYEFDVVGGAHMTWTGTAHVAYDLSGSLQMLNVGYSLYEKTGAKDEYVPYTSTNTPYDADAFLSTYTKIGDKPGGTAFHNLAYSLIDFDYTDSASALLADFDRSSTTIYGALARAGSDYDVTNVYRFVAKDIFDPRIYFAWRNVGYKGKYFAEIADTSLNITQMKSVQLLKKDITSGLEYRAMTDLGIGSFVVIEDGMFTVDENNYVVIVS